MSTNPVPDGANAAATPAGIAGSPNSQIDPELCSPGRKRDGTARKAAKESANTSASSSDKKKLSPSAKLEAEATLLFLKLSGYIKEHKGQYVRDQDGTYHVLLEGKRIALNYDKDNHQLSHLLLEAISMTVHSQAVKPTIARLIDAAHNSAGQFHLRRFSAMSEDGKRLYIPIAAETKLLSVTADDITVVPNGGNLDFIWGEHPYGTPLQYTQADPKEGLSHFQNLLVDTQACKVPAMRWLVAMHEGLFPFIRDRFPARFILSHIGGTQQGKTSGAERFTRLHGLGSVKGDYSVASLGNMHDIGLLVLDNKEHSNLTPQLIDFLLFLATGAERGRSNADGNVRVSGFSRPVCVITSIEGVYKTELRARNVEVHYGVPGDRLLRGPIEAEINKRRHQILSSLIPVLQGYMKIREAHLPSPNPIPPFEEHFTALCDLLRAYGKVAGMPPEWSEKIIDAWARIIAGGEPDENELEQPIWQILREAREQQGGPLSKMMGVSIPNFDVQVHDRVEFEGKRGVLHVTTTGALLMKLKQLRLSDGKIPFSARGLGRRLRDSKFQRFIFVTEENAYDLPQLARKSSVRSIGFFVPD